MARYIEIYGTDELTPNLPVSIGNPQGAPILVDDLAEKGMPVFPDSRINRIYRPGTDTAPYVFTLTHPDDTWSEYSVTSLYFDQYDGELLNVWDGRAKSAGNLVRDRRLYVVA